MSSHTGAVLSKSKIKEAIADGRLTVEPPLEEEAFGCASIDLTLHNEFRMFRSRLDAVDVSEDVDFNDVTDRVVLQEGEKFLLLPGNACLAITREKVTLGPGICGLLEGRSRFARVGLAVHITAGFIQPGVSNRTVLEIFNASSIPLNLIPGVRICQMLFLSVDGEAKYTGRFEQQESL